MIKKRLETLDAIRGLAAIAVVFYHYTVRYYQIYPQEIQLPFDFYSGRYGVQAFFIVSGFVIYMSLTRINRPIDFIVHRFIRLYPTFWFAVLFTFLMVAYFGLAGREVSFVDMLVNLTMIPGPFKVPSVDGVYWTLLYELKFYFWILILYSTNSLKKIETISLYYLLFVLISSVMIWNDELWYKVANQFFMFDNMSFFISGIMFYKIFNDEVNYKSYIVLILAATIGIYFDTHHSPLTLVIIYILFVLLSIHKLEWIAIKPFVFLGSISYALYLIHQNIGYIILNYTFSINLSPWIGTSIALVVSIMIAILITVYVEKTSMKYLKGLYKKNEEKILEFLNNNNFLKFLVITGRRLN